MKIGSAFPGAYLKAADLQGKSVRVTIDRVTMEDIGGETKPILHFRGKERGLAVNKTNGGMITELLGTDETDEWHGRDVVLYPSKTDFQGKRVDCIRVQQAPQQGKPVPPPPPVQEFHASDDDIPF